MEQPPENAGRPQAVNALLGPTNTGKTHRAIERMLDFQTGMMGLPLRLLAREVYDRVSARVGEQAVALVTGEEKRVPAHPRYWICTVEAMPGALDVEFLAIDEIQLIAHPERGHVFTDRLLHWRGSAETWFLGSDTVEALLREQLAGLQVTRLPRLSRLHHVGVASLRSLPRRSALVAFSLQQVYQLADVLRVRRGGAAVVLGALSPRVRNAQVAMYQSGQVDFLVATDAIGMGLNLDIDHVALAAQTKFDGFETRPLETQELAQIVGRAGRYLRDGSFGTLAPLAELGPREVRQLESHRFAAQRTAYYRNAQLDFASLATLLRSLERPPPHPALRAAPAAEDLLTLRALATRSDVTAACGGEPARIETLWDLCRIPNYEKHIPEHQAERLIPLFQQLLEHGRLLPEYLDRELVRLERYEGDLDILLARLAAVRTWLYISHQSGWVDDASAWRERARSLEDRLGDLLHERLLARFVDARSGRTPSRTPKRDLATERDAHHPFAQLASLYGPAEPLAAPGDPWVESVVAAQFAAFELRADGVLWLGGERVARLVRGKTALTPAFKLLTPEFLAAGARSRVERRLLAHVKDLAAHLLEPLYPRERAALLAEPESAPLRGLLYQLEQGLGTVARRDVEAQLRALRASDRAALERWQISTGTASVFAREMLTTERLRLRAALCSSWQPEPYARLPSAELSPYVLLPPGERSLCLRLGYVPLARWGVRCDVLELLLRELAPLPKQPDESARPSAARIAKTRLLLGCSETEASAIVRGLPQSRRRRRRARGAKAAGRAQRDCN